MDLEQKAFERLRFATQQSQYYYQKPLLICYSGGKDSDVLLRLATNSGINFEVQHSHTTVDAPETVYHIRDTFRRMELQGIFCNIDYPTYKGQPTTMWELIPQKKIPPTRIARYCCEVLKESGGKNRVISTGVRKAESVKRRSRGIYEDVARKREDKIILNNDNDDKRQWIERCYKQTKTVVNPIIDWQDADIWDYIKSEHVPCNSLYDCGFKRVGCVGCPIAGKARYAEFRRYPTYQATYIRAFDKMLDNIHQSGRETKWRNGYDVFRWWMEEDYKQIEIESMLEGEM